MAPPDLADWLRALGLERYEQVLRANDVDLDVLHGLNEADLERLGVSLGHRKKLLRAIADLQDGAAAQPTAAPPAAEGERRQVGYTELSRELDAEEVHGLLEHFFERVDDVVVQFGGSIDKHIGDCVMAVLISRGRALAALGRGRRTERIRRELKRLRSAAHSLDYRSALPAIEQALHRFT